VLFTLLVPLYFLMTISSGELTTGGFGGFSVSERFLVFPMNLVL